MIIIVLTALILLIWGWKGSDFIVGALMGGTGIVLGGIVCMFATVFWAPRQPIEHTSAEYQLVNMSDHTYADTEGQVRGGVFVTRGSISTDLAASFSWYQQDGEGYVMKTIDARDATIKYTNGTPKVLVESQRCVRSNPDGPAIGLWFFEICEPNSDGTHYTFYVPEGSIVESYKLGGEDA